MCDLETTGTCCCHCTEALSHTEAMYSQLSANLHTSTLFSMSLWKGKQLLCSEEGVIGWPGFPSRKNKITKNSRLIILWNLPTTLWCHVTSESLTGTLRDSPWSKPFCFSAVRSWLIGPSWSQKPQGSYISRLYREKEFWLKERWSRDTIEGDSFLCKFHCAI